jgi:predicted protein tyrosine phosphatase
MPVETSAPPVPYRVSICGKDEIESFCGKGVTHLLSVEDPDTPKVTPSWFEGVHQQILFHDVESAQFAEECCAVPPTRRSVAEILEFGERCLLDSRSRPVHLLIHCFAGISRSTAVGYALLVQAWGTDRTSEALQRVVEVRPEAFPNLLVVRHADRLLGCAGEMIRTLTPFRAELSRIMEQPEERPEENGAP